MTRYVVLAPGGEHHPIDTEEQAARVRAIMRLLGLDNATVYESSSVEDARVGRGAAIADPFSSAPVPFVPPYAGWQPYCLVCTTMKRMDPIADGWRCSGCSNEIGVDLYHKDGSPRRASQADQDLQRCEVDQTRKAQRGPL